MRDSEPAAQRPVGRRSRCSHSGSAAFAGVAGSLFAIVTYVSPDTFPIKLSLYLLVGVVVSGLGSLTGVIAGAIFIQFLPLWAQEVSRSPGAPGIVYGLVLIAAMVVLPQGVSGLITRIRVLLRR